MAQCSLGNLRFSLLGSLLGISVVFQISLLLKNNELLLFIGRHSIPFFGFNMYANSVAKRLLVLCCDYSWMISFIIQLILLILLVVIINRAGLLGEIISGRYVLQRNN